MKQIALLFKRFPNLVLRLDLASGPIRISVRALIDDEIIGAIENGSVESVPFGSVIKWRPVMTFDPASFDNLEQALSEIPILMYYLEKKNATGS